MGLRLGTGTSEELFVNSELVAELRKYIDRKGFAYEGFWYFRTSWINKDTFRRLKSRGFVDKAGNIAQLRRQGVEFPNKPIYYVRGSQMSLVYRISESKLKELVGED